MESVDVKLPHDMLEACKGFAQRDDVSLGHFIRQAIAHEISRNRNARPPNRADEQLIAPLRARLAGDLAYARSWDDLSARLRAKGFALVPAGGGLALHRWPSNERLCKASELGFSYSKLVHRFQAGFPGHAHTWIEARALSATPSPQEDFDLIEPF